MALGEVTGDGETGAGLVAGAGVVEPAEALEDPPGVLGGHARSVVHGRAGGHLLGSPQGRAKTLTPRRHSRARATTHVNGARIVLYVRDR